MAVAFDLLRVGVFGRTDPAWIDGFRTSAASAAEADLGAVESRLAELEGRTERAEARLASLSGSLEELVVERYTSRGDMPLLTATDINAGVKAEALARSSIHAESEQC